MNVRELITELTKLDPELPVILQKDQEGNGYGPLRCVDDNCAVEDATAWLIDDVRMRELPEDSDYTEDDLAPEEYQQVVVFSP